MDALPRVLNDRVGASADLLDFVGQLLARSDFRNPEFPELLRRLATLFGVNAVGLATLPEGNPFARYPSQAPTPVDLPWQVDPGLIPRVAAMPSGLVIHRGGRWFLLSLIATFQHDTWLIWLEDGGEEFSDRERAALTMVGQALGRWLGQERQPRWAATLQRQAQQRQIETSAAVASRLAHDFGNVLTGILGFTELALTQQIAPQSPLYGYLQEVHQAAQHGAAFTHQLRLFSRRQPVSARSSHLPSAVAEQQARQQALLPVGLNLRIDIPDDLPRVALDGEHLNHILAALLDNAREAVSAQGSISVSARTVQLGEAECGELYGTLRPGVHVELIVADTGVGMSSDAQNRVLLEPFYSTKNRRKGFGLPVTYGILAAHHGGIRLHPGEQCGVVVRVLLPVETLPPPALAEQASLPASASASTARILVVDDTADVLRFVTSTLENNGYRVHGVGSADAAYEAYTGQGSDPFALVVSDVVMPGLTGVDLFRRLHRLDPTTRMVFMSGQVMPDLGQLDHSQSVIEVLHKPFRVEQLLKIVRVALERSPHRPDRRAGLSAVRK